MDVEKVVDALRDRLVAKGGRLVKVEGACRWAVENPPTTIKHVWWKNFTGRWKHLFSGWSIPFIPFRKGTFKTITICLPNLDLIETYRELNPDGTEIRPGITFGAFIPRYVTKEKQ